MLKELVEDIIKKLVDNPEAVAVSEVHVDGKYIIQARVQAHDLGRVIGNEGRTFRALRMLIQALDVAHSRDLVVDVAE